MSYIERHRSLTAAIITLMVLCVNCNGEDKTTSLRANSPQGEWYKYANVRFSRYHYPTLLTNTSYAHDEIKLTKELGCDTLIFFISNQKGVALYNSKVAPKEPLLGDRDLLDEILAEAKKEGIRVIPGWYGSSFTFYQHPEWGIIAQSYADIGKRKIGEEVPLADISTFKHGFMCYNSPQRKWQLDQFQEVLENYDVAGIYLDGLCFPFNGCWCPYCQEVFEKEFGHKMPTNAWNHELYEFRTQTVVRAAREIREVVNKTKPRAIFASDCHGTFIGERSGYESIALTAPYIDVYILEVYWNMSKELPSYVGMESRLVQAETGKQVWCPKWIGRSPGVDYTTISPTAAKIWIGEAMASGSGVTTIDWNSFFYDRTCFSILSDAHRLVTKLRPYLLKSKSVKYAAILHSMESNRFRLFADPVRERRYFEGFYTACQEAHIPFDVVTEREILDGTINQYPVLILPNVEYMSDKVVTAIEKYVEAGHGLVMSNLTSLYDEKGTKRNDLALGRLAGVRFTGTSLWNGGTGSCNNAATNFYQAVSKSPITEGLETNTYSFAGALHIVDPNKDAHVQIKTRNNSTPPEGFTISDWFAPGDLANPLVVTKESAGRVVYIAGELDGAFWSFGWPEIGKILSHSIVYAGNSELPFSTDCPEPVLITNRAADDGKSMVFFFVNYATNQLYTPADAIITPADGNPSFALMRNNEMRYAIAHKNVTLSMPNNYKTVWSGTGQKISLVHKHNRTIITIPQINEYEVIVLLK